MLSKDPALPDGPVLGGGAVRRRLGVVHLRAADPRVPARDARGRVRRPRRAGADGRRDARRDDRRRRAVHRPGPPRGRHGVPVRARRPRPRRQQVGPPAARPAATSRRRSGAGRPGSPTSGWNSLYWDNHDQPRIVSRWGDDGEHRVRSATMLATVLHLHRGTPYVYQGEELGMTNVRVHVDRATSATSRRATTTARPSAAAHDPAAVLAAMAPMHRDNARTPMQWDDSPHAGFTTGTPWIAVNPNHTTINAAAARADDRLGVPPLPAADRAAPHVGRRRRRRLHDAAAPTTRTSTRSPARSATRRCSCSATSPATHQRWTASRRSTTGPAPRSCSATSTTPRPIGGRAAPVGGRRAGARVG